MTLAALLGLGVRRIVAFCNAPLRSHAGLVDVDGLPDDAHVPEVADRAPCSRCGGKTISTKAD